MIDDFVLIAFSVAFFFGLGMYFGYEVGQPTEQQKEIIDKVCEYIYENETLEVYTEYCK